MMYFIVRPCNDVTKIPGSQRSSCHPANIMMYLAISPWMGWSTILYIYMPILVIIIIIIICIPFFNTCLLPSFCYKYNTFQCENKCTSYAPR
jgi:hypothetical protein